jgi:hypothetical protein
MSVLSLFTQPLQAFQQPEAKDADSVDTGSFLDQLFDLSQPLLAMAGR